MYRGKLIVEKNGQEKCVRYPIVGKREINLNNGRMDSKNTMYGIQCTSIKWMIHTHAAIFRTF